MHSEHFSESNLLHSELCFVAQRLRAHIVEPDCLGFELEKGYSPFFDTILIWEKELILELPSKEIERLEVTHKDVEQTWHSKQ